MGEETTPVAVELGPEHMTPSTAPVVSQLRFGQVQTDDDIVSVDRLGKKAAERASDSMPFDEWCRTTVPWENGGYAVRINREQPLVYNPGTGRTYRVGGFLGAFQRPVTQEDIAQEFGGGQFNAELMGPGDDGLARLVARYPRLPSQPGFRIAINPKPRDMDEEGGEMAVQGNVVGVAVEALKDVSKDKDLQLAAMRAEAEKAKAAASGNGAQVNEKLLELTERSAKSETAADRVRLESRAQQAEAELVASRRTLDEMRLKIDSFERNQRSPASEMGTMLEGVGKIISPVLAGGAQGSPADVQHAVGMALAQADQRHREELGRLRDHYEGMLADERRGRRDRADEFDRDMRKRLDDAETQRKRDVETAGQMARLGVENQTAIERQRANAAEQSVAQLREDIRDLKAELARTADSLNTSRTTHADAIATARADIARLQAELKHAPKAEGDLDSITKIGKIAASIDTLRGDTGGGRRSRDDDDMKPTSPPALEQVGNFLEQPTVSTIFSRVAGALSGDSQKQREHELQLAAIEAEKEKARLADQISRRHRIMAQQQGAQQGQVGAPGAAPSPQSQPQNPYLRAGEELPPVPVTRNIAPDAEPYRAWLLKIEQFLRDGVSPQQFIAAAKADGIEPVVVKSVLMKRWPTPLSFLGAMQPKIAEAFAALYHPAGRRWLEQLWPAVQQAAGD